MNTPETTPASNIRSIDSIPVPVDEDEEEGAARGRNGVDLINELGKVCCCSLPTPPKRRIYSNTLFSPIPDYVSLPLIITSLRPYQTPSPSFPVKLPPLLPGY